MATPLLKCMQTHMAGHKGELLTMVVMTSARCDVERRYRPSLSRGKNLCAAQ